MNNYTIIVYRIPSGGSKKDAYLLLKIHVSILPDNIPEWIKSLGGDYYEIEDNYSSDSVD